MNSIAMTQQKKGGDYRAENQYHHKDSPHSIYHKNVSIEPDGMIYVESECLVGWERHRDKLMTEQFSRYDIHYL